MKELPVLMKKYLILQMSVVRMSSCVVCTLVRYETQLLHFVIKTF